MLPRRLALLVPLIPLLALLLGIVPACSPPPEDDGVGSLRARIIYDRFILKYIQAFTVDVFETKTAAGSTLECTDIPGTYTISDTRLVPIPVGSDGKNELAIKWDTSSPSEEIKLAQVTLPADTPVLVVIRGLAAKQGMGTPTIGRGCTDRDSDGKELTFKGGATGDITVDVKATTGMPCSRQADCETGLTCNTGTYFNGGYCAKVSCSGDQVCPPATSCVTNSSTGGMCLRGCSGVSDCNVDSSIQSVQDCTSRLGPTSGGCASVCVSLLWNSENDCSSSS
jgi:hypothetical protein